MISCDVNAMHMFCDSSENNERGESLLDFIINANLSLCSRDSTPASHFLSSWYCNGWEKVLDITLVTDSEIFEVEGWVVNDHRSFSDYNWIICSLNFAVKFAFPFPFGKFGKIIKLSSPNTLKFPIKTLVQQLNWSQRSEP